MSILDSPAEAISPARPRDPLRPTAPSRVDEAVERGLSYLLGIQNEDGHWRAQLEGDTILESEYILTLCFLGRLGDGKAVKAGETLRRAQTSTGGWNTFPGGVDDVNPTVKAYFSLKLLGDPANAPHMLAAREAARTLGGLEACNSFTKIYLAVFGQFPWSRCPAVPPELMLLPSWAPFNIYQMSSWSRAIVVPLSIIRALRPRVDVPAEAALGDLHMPARPRDRAPSIAAACWGRLFRVVDGLLRFYERAPLPGLRRRALDGARRWTVEHLEGSDGLGAIFPPIINSIFALRTLGREEDESLVLDQVGELERLEIEDAETLKIQPCLSPVWDTALSLSTLLEAGLAPDSEAAARATRWLLDHEVRRPGDWARRRAKAPVGGWYFEYANPFYPDTDDTAQVISGLSQVRLAGEADQARLDRALARGVAWLEGMQNRDGGWGAFDKDCDREFLTHIPFADHNAMIDPATVDVTARVIDALLRSGVKREADILKRAASFIRQLQEDDGSWFGRWGCNYIYGTWLAAWALRRVGESVESPTLRGAASWLESHQNEDGGWGELPLSYSRPSARGRGPSTACQTAWALIGLMASGVWQGVSLERGFDYLLRSQEVGGDWLDEHWTGTGFPGVFYLRYHGYATYFPLMALATLRRLRAGEPVFSTPHVLGSAEAKLNGWTPGG